MEWNIWNDLPLSGGPIWINPIHNEEFVLKLHRSLRECSQLEVTDLPDFESLREHEKEKTEDVTSPVDEAVSNKITNDNTEGKDIKITCKSERISQRGTFQTLRRMQGIVNVISEELFDIPLHYTQEKLSQVCYVTYHFQEFCTINYPRKVKRKSSYCVAVAVGSSNRHVADDEAPISYYECWLQGELFAHESNFSQNKCSSSSYLGHHASLD